jgi:hypothetical protein
MAWRFNPFSGNLDYTDTSTDSESVQDIIGATLLAGPNITIVYDDPANTVTISNTAQDLVSITQYGAF